MRSILTLTAHDIRTMSRERMQALVELNQGLDHARQVSGKLTSLRASVTAARGEAIAALTTNQCPFGTADKDGGWWLGGVYVGDYLGEGMFAAEEAAHRRVIRRYVSSLRFADRAGEVLGSGGHYQAVTMAGDHIGNAKTLTGAAKLVADHDENWQARVAA